MSIQILDSDTINKIAAGEVVERPSSVVKELVENSIDAGASAITIEIKDGGITMTRITDNGVGIPYEDIHNAFLRHATSKIRTIEDLVNVSSLGFRGEALSSIASVAQVELITKTNDNIIGYRYVIEGGEEKNFDEVGVPDGTTFVIRNLFFNTPVRRKFLKSPVTEATYIGNLIEHLALSHPEISFRFINNNQNKLYTAGNNNLKDIIYEIYGKDITRNLKVISAETQDIKISGFIGNPSICRGNRLYENYFINGRFIKSPIITKAIEEAYKGHIMPHNYPFTAIHFEINPAILDVNVHPTKMELRFTKNEFVYNFVLNAIKDTLKKGDLAVNVSLESSAMKKIEKQYENNCISSGSELKNNKVDYLINKSDNNVDNKHSIHSQKKVYDKPAITLEELPKEKGKADMSPSKENISTELSSSKIITRKDENIRKNENVKERLPEPFEKKRFSEMICEEKNVYSNDKKIVTEQISLFDNPLMKAENEENYRIIGQLFDTYWLIEYEDKFYIMDQHAAHEKIIYEQFMNKIKENSIDMQMIMPVIIELSLQQESTLKQNEEYFRKMGFEIENFGGRSYKVTGIPSNFPNVNVSQMLIDMLDELTDKKVYDMGIITERVATMACKAAVKGNNKMSHKEALELVKKLMASENPYNCPHGRPTLIMMSKYDIERKFKRIL